MKDLFGKAILDFCQGHHTEDLITSTSISDEETLPLSYLFRDYSKMPELEQKALDLSFGKILDIGCGAGSHSLHLLQKEFDVKSIDISRNAIKACKLRGIKNAHVMDFIDESETFDTILLLMNGSGVFRSLSQLPYFLNHLKNLLRKNGQLLMDSSDIKYMFEDVDGTYPHLPLDHYYGELDYTITYRGASETFPWMYLDFDRLEQACAILNLKCELIKEGEHYDYLARITAK